MRSASIVGLPIITTSFVPGMTANEHGSNMTGPQRVCKALGRGKGFASRSQHCHQPVSPAVIGSVLWSSPPLVHVQVHDQLSVDTGGWEMRFT